MSHHHPHHNYPNHGRPHRLSPTGGDSHSGSLYSEVSNNLSNTNPTAQRSTPVPCDPLYYPPVQQQQTHPPNPTDSYQQLSEARYRNSQMHCDSYNRASPSSSSTDPWRPSSLDVPGGGRLQGLPHYPSHADLRISPTSSNFCSSHSVYSPTSSFLQYQPPVSFAHPAEHSPSRGAVPTVTATDTQSMGTSHASLERTTSSSRGPTQLSYADVPTAPSLLPHDVPSETADLTIKKRRKRADPRQLEALNGMYARTAFPSLEDRQELARDLDMSARSVQIWFKNKRQASRQGGRSAPNPPTSQVIVTPLSPVPTVLAFLILLATVTAFVVART